MVLGILRLPRRLCRGCQEQDGELCRGQLESSVVDLEAVKSGSATGVRLGVKIRVNNGGL